MTIQSHDCLVADRKVHEGTCDWLNADIVDLEEMAEEDKMRHPEDREDGSGYYPHVPMYQESVQYNRRHRLEEMLLAEVRGWTRERKGQVSNQTNHRMNSQLT